MESRIPKLSKTGTLTREDIPRRDVFPREERYLLKKTRSNQYCRALARICYPPCSNNVATF